MCFFCFFLQAENGPPTSDEAYNFFTFNFEPEPIYRPEKIVMKRQKPMKNAKKSRDEVEDGDEQEDAEDDEDQDENQVALEILCFVGLSVNRTPHPLNVFYSLSHQRMKSLLWCKMRTMRICSSSSKQDGTSWT